MPDILDWQPACGSGRLFRKQLPVRQTAMVWCDGCVVAGTGAARARDGGGIFAGDHHMMLDFKNEVSCEIRTSHRLVSVEIIRYRRCRHETQFTSRAGMKK